MQVGPLRKSERAHWSAEGGRSWRSGPTVPVLARRASAEERLGNSRLPLEMQPKVTASKKPFESPLFYPSGRGGQRPRSPLWAADVPCNTKSVLSPVTLTVFPGRRRDFGGVGSV